jgi:uncharacterized phage protein (TIGR01671 family)
MNNRFRFRVFYKPHNKIYNVICLNSDRQKEIIIEYKGSTALVEWENCDILQCTGLKDKNGKLIYENDILYENLINDVFPKGKYWIVKWNNNQAQFYMELINKADNSLTDTWHLARHDLDYEVVGNIYENEELLNVQSSVFDTINLKSLF